MNASNSVKYPNPKTRRLTEVQDSPAKVLIADIAHYYNHPPLQRLSPDQTGYRHNTRANMLFFDGHVAGYTTKQTNTVSLKLDSF